MEIEPVLQALVTRQRKRICDADFGYFSRSYTLNPIRYTLFNP
jgi:hypothetical protein